MFTSYMATYGLCHVGNSIELCGQYPGKLYEPANGFAPTPSHATYGRPCNPEDAMSESSYIKDVLLTHDLIP